MNKFPLEFLLKYNQNLMNCGDFKSASVIWPGVARNCFNLKVVPLLVTFKHCMALGSAL